MKEVHETISALKDDQEANQLTMLELKERLSDTDVLFNKLSELVKKCCEKNAAFAAQLKTQYITRQDFETELKHVVSIIQQDLLDTAKNDVHAFINNKVTTISNDSSLSSKEGISRLDVEQVVKSALLTYGADKTGAFDFALETAGGSVVSTRCTQFYTAKLPQYTWFGIPLWLPAPLWGKATNPRTAIQPGIMPGECWAFKGSEGFLVIKLAMPMRPTRFSLEHIPKSLSPNGRIDSAPKDFLVLGLQEEKDSNPVELGRFTYDEDGEPLQFFNAENPTLQSFALAELRILNNHGNVEYTCLYRFRVHGSL